MMKCVMKTAAGPGNLQFVQREIPECGEWDVLIRVLATAVCGTDVHIRGWNDWADRYVTPPVVIGHEFSGEVVKTGAKVKGVKTGEMVSAETHIPCNSCEICRIGERHVCPHSGLIGVNRDGCFAEYISLPYQNVVVCDPSVKPEYLCLMEPLGAAVHGVMQYPVAGRKVVVNGCGPIGAMAVAVAKLCGAARVIAVEPNPIRAELAKNMGADVVIDPAKENAEQVIKGIAKYGADMVLEYSGNAKAIEGVFRFVRPEGKIVLVGLPSDKPSVNFSDFIYRGITIKGIAGRKIFNTWEDMNGMFAAGLDLEPIISHTLPLEDYEKGLDMMLKGECVKTILKP